MLSDHLTDLRGVGAVVTGAGSGLGHGIALSLAERGAQVAVLDFDFAGADETKNMIERKGFRAWAFQADVTDENALDHAVDESAKKLSGIDLLVNSAGILSVSSVLDLPLAEWRRVLEVNATGVFLASRAVARIMIDTGRSGSIVSIASIAGKVGDAGLAHYSASKFAVIGFTQALAKELAPHNITVNALCPGVVETPMIGELADAWNSSVEELLDAQLIHRPQTPEEIANSIVFLHGSRSITGQAINVDGGTVFY